MMELAVLTKGQVRQDFQSASIRERLVPSGHNLPGSVTPIQPPTVPLIGISFCSPQLAPNPYTNQIRMAAGVPVMVGLRVTSSTIGLPASAGACAELAVIHGQCNPCARHRPSAPGP